MALWFVVPRNSLGGAGFDPPSVCVSDDEQDRDICYISDDDMTTVDRLDFRRRGGGESFVGYHRKYQRTGFEFCQKKEEKDVLFFIN
uniref:Uncharacterized protein n=1 Tax=Setaria digitata TaxID=48799 RepID=A0A915PLG5_9BILA